MVNYPRSCVTESNTRLHHQGVEAPQDVGPRLSSLGSRSALALHVDGWNRHQDAQSAAQQMRINTSAATSTFGFQENSPQRTSWNNTGLNGHLAFDARDTRPQVVGQKRAYRYSNGNDEERDTAVRDYNSSLANDRLAKRNSVHASKRAREGDSATVPDYDNTPSSTATSFSESHSGGVRIDDLLNPTAVGVAAMAASAAGGPALNAAHRMTVPSSLSRAYSADSKHYYQQLRQLQLQFQLKQQQQQKRGVLPAPTADPTSRFMRTATAPTERTGRTNNASDFSARGLVREALELDKLYDIACVIIESIWPNHSVSQRTQLCSLRCFVAETHRQTRLSVDTLELCMFYLLRAKSIIQTKQLAERDREQQQQQLILQQKNAAARDAASAAATPPMSPTSVLDNSGRRMSVANVGGLISAAMVVPVTSGPGVVVPSSASGTFTSPLGSSPLTPDSAQQANQAYSDKQTMLGSGMITPLTPEKARRALAGSTFSLPNSYRSFVVAAKPAAETAAGGCDAQQQVAAGQLQSGSEEKKAPAAGNINSAKSPGKSNVTKCGRRMFVAALICASKFITDYTYSNETWNKITRLPLRQISDMERAFLDMIDYRLYVDGTTYEKFHRLLARSGMRNGRLMVCDSGAATSLPTSAPLPSSISRATTATNDHKQQPMKARPHYTAHASTPMSAAATAVPSPVTPMSATGCMGLPQLDLRMAMNIPLSISSTPVINRVATGTTMET
ncbi:PHO85 cyclin-5 [Coemansia sp. RSA 1365]|nr:PHO85 cyclin-5 [Coemansia sp. RSA 1365]